MLTEEGIRLTEKKMKLLPAEKFGLTVEEAADYFEIGTKKLRQIIDQHQDDGFCTRNGSKTIILRPEFEKFLISASEI